jgi:hypothetical protein
VSSSSSRFDRQRRPTTTTITYAKLILGKAFERELPTFAKSTVALHEVFLNNMKKTPLGYWVKAKDKIQIATPKAKSHRLHTHRIKELESLSSSGAFEWNSPRVK